MRAGLDLLFLIPGETGGRETHVRALLPALRAAAPHIHFTAFLNRETARAGPGWWAEHVDRAIVLTGASARARARWALSEAHLVRRAAARAGVTLMHSPANFGPWGGPFARVLTLHDVGFRTHPELLTPAMRVGSEVLVVAAARRAHRIITVSQSSRRDIVERLGVPAERVVVVPNGIAPPGPGDRERGLQRLGNPRRPVVLSVASDLPHKNLDTLARAAAALGDQAPLLALAGHGTERRSGPNVVGLGGVTSGELEDLYAAADGLITATRYEGFGLPVLEGLARGVPVAASDLPVLREVGGDGVLFFDPDDPAAVAAALRDVVGRSADRERTARFTWEGAAAGTIAVYEEALAVAGRGPSRPARPSR